MKYIILLKIFPEIRIRYCYGGFGNTNNILFTNKKIPKRITVFVRGGRVFQIYYSLCILDRNFNYNCNSNPKTLD